MEEYNFNRKKGANTGDFLEEMYKKFCHMGFIQDDPVSIPHRFTKRQDSEIMAFWTAMISWGNRKSILRSADQLLNIMDNAPHDFILHHEDVDLVKLEKYVHRTFQPIDALGFIHFLRHHYQSHSSLEAAFVPSEGFVDIKSTLIHFHNNMFDDKEQIAQRTKKHIATPANKSTCKRMNMFLRWMVRSNKEGVDFGLWKSIPTSALMMPLDVHVERIGRQLGLISRKQTDWQTVEELTANLRKFDPDDPVKYDFALFGLGVAK